MCCLRAHVRVPYAVVGLRPTINTLAPSFSATDTFIVIAPVASIAMEEKLYVLTTWSTQAYVIRATSEAEAKGRAFEEGLSSSDVKEFAEASTVVEESDRKSIVKL